MPDLDFEPGDLLLFYGRGWQSRVIEAVTFGPSHVGIVTEWCAGLSVQPKGDCPLLLAESTSLCPHPDFITGEMICGVQLHPPAQRVADYAGRVRRMRLRKPHDLSPADIGRLSGLVQYYHGEPYDLRGALCSGTRLFKWLPFVPYPDLGHLFCSEFVAELLIQLGRFRLDDPGRYNPASLVHALRRWAVYQAPEEIHL
jgi:hypothetical protein